MNLTEYIDGKSNSKFILDYDRFTEILRSMTRQSILSLPHPTKKEIHAFTPLSYTHITHISFMLATHQHIHSIFTSFVPLELPENIFWCKYFKYLYVESKKEEKYKSILKHRERKRNEHLTHVLTLWTGLAENRKESINNSINAKEGLLTITGVKGYFHNHSHLQKTVNQVIKVIIPFSSASSTQGKRLFALFTTPYDPNFYDHSLDLIFRSVSLSNSSSNSPVNVPSNASKKIKHQHGSSHSKSQTTMKVSKDVMQTKDLKVVKGKKEQKEKPDHSLIMSTPLSLGSSSESFSESMNENNNINNNNENKSHKSQQHHHDTSRMSLDMPRPKIRVEQHSRESPQLLGNGILNKPRLSDVEMKRNSITNNDSDIPTYRMILMAFTYLFLKMKKYQFQFIGPLLHFLLKHFTPIESYSICQSFIHNCFCNGMYPLTMTQFDYLFLALDGLIRERFPEYIQSLKVSTTSIYENLLINMMIPLLESIEKFSALMILQHIYLEGYPFVLKLILTLIEHSPHPPRSNEEVVIIFSTLLDYDPIGMITIAKEMSFPSYCNYHFFVPIKETIHSTHSSIDINVQNEQSRQDVLQRNIMSHVIPTDMLNEELYYKMVEMLPDRFATFGFTCLFSSKTDGFALSTLYSLCVARYPLIILIRDSHGCLFGGLITHELTISRRYYGTAEMYLFQLEPKCKKFTATKANNFFVLTEVDKLSMGGGNGEPGLYLDRDLNGKTYPCPTYDNAMLSTENVFKPVRLEVWTCVSEGIIKNLTSATDSSHKSGDV